MPPLVPFASSPHTATRHAARQLQRTTGAPGVHTLRAVHSQAVRVTDPIPDSLRSSITTDITVPEGHKGLHGFLYGSGGAEEHDVVETSLVARRDEDDGSLLMPVSTFLSNRDGEKPLGVYSVYDSNGVLQYIGYSRNMVLAIKGHLARFGESKVAAVRMKVFKNKAMASRSNMEREVHTLLEEYMASSGGLPPPGNSSEAEAWGVETTESDPSLMSPAERERYEAKKLKLRKAMGEDVLGGKDAPADDAATRRLKLIAAVEGGDWSAEINSQTAETVAAASGAGEPAAAAAGDASAASSNSSSEAGTIVSPFANNESATAVANREGRAYVPLTIKAAEEALEEVRPYLMADGGDIEVVSVEGGVVAVRLQGSCSTCASSAATMKNGVEKVIRNTFGDQVKEIVQLDKGAKPPLTVAMVDLQLNMLRGAIHNFGGAVEVAAVEAGVVKLRYIGPPAIGKGIAAAVKDAFAPDIKEVVFVHD